MSIIRKRNPYPVRAWLEPRIDQLRPILAPHGFRVDKAYQWGTLPLTWWAPLIRAKAATMDELCTIHEIQPGVQRAMTEIQVRDPAGLQKLAKRLGVAERTMVKWRSLNGVPRYVAGDFVAAVRDAGVQIRRSDIRQEVFRAETRADRSVHA